MYTVKVFSQRYSGTQSNEITTKHSELVIRIINYKLIVLYAVAKTFKEHECFVIV